MFDHSYYESLWGTVHRHDYCFQLAEQLVDRFGICKILDIGTGCGFLVKCLRELGCEAWGLDVSDYALSQSCANGHVLKGSIANRTPFATGYFDVVHSQGMWEYVSELDVPKASLECNRIGRHQIHNIDEGGLGVELFATVRPHVWWNEKLLPPKILVACPNHESKQYAFDRWLANVKNLTYTNYDVLVVDNSPGLDFFNAYKDWDPLVHMVHLEPDPAWDGAQRIARSMELIRQHFLSGPYTRWFNLEADVIPPTSVIETLLALGGEADWISHAYPNRTLLATFEDVQVEQGIGCSMFSRRLMEKFDLTMFGNVRSVDGHLWEMVRPDKTLQTTELWNHIRVNHLAQ